MSDDENAVLVMASSRLKPVPRHRANIEITPVGACGLYPHTVASGLIAQAMNTGEGLNASVGPALAGKAACLTMKMQCLYWPLPG